jgi:hypothetical protein
MYVPLEPPVTSVQSAARGLCVLALAAVVLLGGPGVAPTAVADEGWSVVPSAGGPDGRPYKDPVFQVGTSHGVFAPQWEEQQWRGTIEPGKKAQIELPVELSAGAHGDYTVSVKYGGKVLAEQPWGVGRPWGVTLFWILLFIVVPAAVFRIGMAVVDRVRPQGRSRPAGRWGSRPRSGGGGGHAGPRRSLRLPEVTVRMPKLSFSSTASSPHADADSDARTNPTLPWFTPDTDPGAEAGQLSAPQENSPKTPTREGNL